MSFLICSIKISKIVARSKRVNNWKIRCFSIEFKEITYFYTLKKGQNVKNINVEEFLVRVRCKTVSYTVDDQVKEYKNEIIREQNYFVVTENFVNLTLAELTVFIILYF